MQKCEEDAFAPKFACCRGEYFYKSEHVFVGNKKDIYVVCFLPHFLCKLELPRQRQVSTGEKTLYKHILRWRKIETLNNTSIVC